MSHVDTLRTFVDDDRGQDLIEYGLLAGFISLIVVLTVTNLGQALDGLYGGRRHPAAVEVSG